MFILSNKAVKFHFKLLKLCLVFILFQACKIYQDPISFDQAMNSEGSGYLKITMLNGDELIYESIEVIEGIYYGIYFENGEMVKTLLVKENIKDVQLRNKKATKSGNMLGFGIAILSILYAVFLL